MSEDDREKTYEVGYGKPPKKAQFKKGVSGNPKGRKPQVKNAATLLAFELDQVIVAREGDKEVRLTKRVALMKSLVNDAITGKRNSRELLLRLLNMSAPPEPFTVNDEDEAAMDDFLARKLAEQAGGNGAGTKTDGGDRDDEPQ